MAEQRPFKKEYNQPDVMSNWLYAKPVEQGGKRPNLRAKVIKNVPRFTVKTNVQGDTNNGNIDFQMDYPTFCAILNTIVDIADGTETNTVRFEYIDDFVAGKKLSERVVLTTVEIGRTKDGEVYFAVLSSQQGRPRIQFIFGPSKFHSVTYKNAEIPQAKISEAYAKGFAKMYLEMIAPLLIQHFDEEGRNVARAPQDQKGNGGYGGGNGGGGYRSNQGGGNYRSNNQQGGGGYNRGNQGGGAPGNPSANNQDDFAGADDFSDF